MKKNLTIFMAAVTIIILANWSSNQPLDTVEFEGVLKTQLGNIENVTHITIGDGKKVKQIPVYEAGQSLSRLEGQVKNKEGDIILATDPKNVTTFIDLDAIKEVHVLSPNQKFVYQKNEQFHKEEYITIEVTAKGTSEQKTIYLVNYNLEIYCNKVNGVDIGAEQKALLRGIDSLKITGYYFKPKEFPKVGKKCDSEQESFQASKKEKNALEN